MWTTYSMRTGQLVYSTARLYGCTGTVCYIFATGSNCTVHVMQLYHNTVSNYDRVAPVSLVTYMLSATGESDGNCFQAEALNIINVQHSARTRRTNGFRYKYKLANR